MTDDQIVEWLKRAVSKVDTRPGLRKVQALDGYLATADGFRMHVYAGDLEIPEGYRVNDPREDLSSKFIDTLNSWGYGQPIERPLIEIDSIQMMVTPDLTPVVQFGEKFVQWWWWRDAIPQGMKRMRFIETDKPVVVQFEGGALEAYIMPIAVRPGSVRVPAPGREMQLVRRYLSLHEMMTDLDDRVEAISEDSQYYDADGGYGYWGEEGDRFGHLNDAGQALAKKWSARHRRAWELRDRVRDELKSGYGYFTWRQEAEAPTEF